METKPDLLVVHKKEVLIVLILFVLVAAFSFTLGLRMGKSMQSSGHSTDNANACGPASTPLVKAIPESQEVSHEVAHDEASNHSQGNSNHESASDHEGGTSQKASSNVAEETADAELAKEVHEHRIGLEKPIPMSLPKHKKTEKHASSTRYTLQVGAHRSAIEANQQISKLKKEGFDAFYFEAEIPGKGTWYRVGVGVFETKENAEKTATKWKTAKALPEYIIQKVSE